MKEIKDIIWRHDKTDKLYKTIGTALNCTNAQDGQIMYIYTNGSMTFVREANEFLAKFTACELLGDE